MFDLLAEAVPLQHPQRGLCCWAQVTIVLLLAVTGCRPRQRLLCRAGGGSEAEAVVAATVTAPTVQL